MQSCRITSILVLCTFAIAAVFWSHANISSRVFSSDITSKTSERFKDIFMGHQTPTVPLSLETTITHQPREQNFSVDIPNYSHQKNPGWMVHFTLTSSNPHLSALYLCALASAARFAQETSTAIILHTTIEPNLLSIGNLSSLIVVSALNYLKVFNNTPLMDWYTAPNRTMDEFYTYNLRNALRLALLYTHGGTYLDLDMLVLDPSLLRIRDSEGALAFQESTALNGAFLAFGQQKSRWLYVAMENFVSSYAPVWGRNGPVLITRTCFGNTPRSYIPKATHCTSSNKGKLAGSSLPKLYPMDKIYGLLWVPEEYGMLFTSTANALEWWEKRSPLAVHFYAHTLQSMGKKCFTQGSLGAKLLQNACPSVEMSELICV